MELKCKIESPRINLSLANRVIGLFSRVRYKSHKSPITMLYSNTDIPLPPRTCIYVCNMYMYGITPPYILLNKV